ncbi:MAG: hypothetical protein RL119_1120 [Actinomycetota bacterium]
MSLVTSRAKEATDGKAQGREFIFLVTALMASMALAIDIMLPAFPEMRREFGMSADSTQVAWVITAFFLGVAIGPWLYGPASDRFGRRRPLLIGLSFYVAGGLLATVAPSWTTIVIARFLWGLGAAAPRSLSLAMIRDRFDGQDMARLMSMIMAVFLLVPIIAPSLGAGLIAILPWRVVFWFPSLVGIALLLWCRRLPETLPDSHRRPFTTASVSGAIREVVSHRQTVSFTLAVMFLFGVMTTYLTGSEIILEDVYGYGSWFPVFFGAVAVLLAVNSLNNARLVRTVPVIPLIRRTSLIAMTAGMALVLISLLTQGRPSFWLFTLALCAVIPVTQGLAPNCNTAAIAPVPHVAGTASAIIATVTTAGGALLGNLANSAFDGTTRPLALACALYIAVATGLIWWGSSTRSRTKN